MNKDVMDKIREARKYQNMAVRALFPEKVVGHLEVIEEELKAMLKEVVVEVVKQETKKQNDRDSEPVINKEDSSKIKKVKIV
ncbi:MAG: hypothetical protein ACERKZ_14140 [Lachnotalea sp.]